MNRLTILPTKWRIDRPHDPHSDPYLLGWMKAKKACAEELEQVLAAYPEALDTPQAEPPTAAESRGSE